MKFTRQQTIALFQGLQAVTMVSRRSGSMANPKFNYAISRNLAKLKSTITEIDETRKEALKEFTAGEQAIIEAHAERDEKGAVVRNPNGSYKVPADKQGELVTAREGYNKANKELLDTDTKYLEEQIEVDVYLLDLATFPDLPTDVQDTLFPIIKPPDEN